MLDATVRDPDLAGIALAGLTARPRTLPPKLFYDAEGVRLFGEITRLPEYYLTRTERALLDEAAPGVAALMPAGSALVEFGACDEDKAMTLLASGRFAVYVPVDVAETALRALEARLRGRLPGLAVHPVAADFLEPLGLPEAAAGRPRLGFFPGSTIGNLDPPAARRFLRQARLTLGEGSRMLLGADLRKDPALLLPAYDDAAGVTARFNLNLLARLNREAGADFDLSRFAHEARWNAAEGRIEMHLRSLVPQEVRLAGTVLRFAAGETIHTENSYKYTLPDLAALAAAGGWATERVWTDRAGLYSLHLLRASA